MNAPVESEQPATFTPLSPAIMVSLAMDRAQMADVVGGDELLLVLLSRLPTVRRWTAGERGRWLRAFGGCLDYLVETETSE